MARCLLVQPNGTFRWVVWPQREASERMGGPLTFVGGSYELIFVARRDEIGPTHCWYREGGPLDEAAYGAVLVVASDEHGSEIDVTDELLPEKLREQLLVDDAPGPA